MERRFDKHFSDWFPKDHLGNPYLTDEEKELRRIHIKNWLNEDEAAKYIGVSRKFIYDLRIVGTPFAGTLPYSKLGKRTIIKRTNIDKYLEQLTVKSEL